MELILGGDANSHHTQWGNTNTNERGELLYDYLLQSNLFICNRGNDPTFITRNRREVLDITLISDPLHNQLVAWKVGTEHSFSDHRYIEFTISLDCPPAKNITNLRLTNWGYYKNLLNRNIHAPPTHIRNRQELDNLVNTFTDICGEAIKRACPSRTVKTKHKPPWWNATLANLKKKCRTYFNRAKYNNSESSWSLYHTKLSLYKKEIRISKRRAWANFCSSIEPTAEASRLKRILAKAPATIGYLKTNADSWTENSQETLELLLDTHFPKNTWVWRTST